MRSITSAMRTFRYWLPSVILIIVASLQKYCVVVHHLDPWLAGGFSMFAHVDHHRFRSIQIRCRDIDHDEFDCTPAFKEAPIDVLQRTLIFPSRTNLCAFAQRYHAGSNKRPTTKPVAVQVNTIALDSQGPAITKSLLAQFEVYP